MTKASDNLYPSVVFVETANASIGTPSAGDQRLFIDTDHLLKYKNSGGTVTAVANATGNVATDTIWDAAGDLAVGTGADTAAKLTKGNAGGVLAMGNSAVIWNAGTSFPGSKATNDRYWRTDLGLEFFWDGTRWVSTTLYHLPLAGPFDGSTTAVMNGWPNVAASPAATISRMSLWHSDFAIWLVSLYGETYTNATNDGSNYWHYSLAGAVTNTAYGNFTTAADTAGTHTGHAVALNQVAGSTERGLIMSMSKTGTPGTTYGPTGVTYRLIGV